MNDLVVFLLFLAFFHASEFALAWAFHPAEVSTSSWLVSKPYCFAMSLAVAEYLAEKALVPGSKGNRHVACAGAVLAILGESLRKAAILTAKSSFTQVIQTYRRPQHVLVTSGVYRHFRHPGYLGWMLWCLGTQILLQNPLCFLVFAAWSWRFFAERIPYEEELLLEMFGAEYRDYASRTRLWIPLIEGRRR